MTVPNAGTECVLREVAKERFRQDVMWGDIHNRNLSPLQLLSILTEEVGEVAMAINENDPVNYREELIQVAAVAVAMVESYDGQVWESPWN